MRWILALALVACGGTEERFSPLSFQGSGGSAPVEAGGTAGSGGASGSGSVSAVDAGADRVDAEPEAGMADAEVADSGQDVVVDRCPSGGIVAYSVAELRARDPRECYAQHPDAGWAPWPEDGGFPGEVCCRSVTFAWRDDIGCGERGVLFSEPNRDRGCDQSGVVLGKPIDAVRCCQ